MTKETFYTDYRTAATWQCSIIMCNNIPEIDPTVWDNMRFNYYDEDDNATEIFQWYITNLTDSDIEYMERTFDLKYTYSDLLDKYILCVDNWGTSWDYVACEVLSDSWIESNKDLEYKH